ncbi:Hemicentin-1,Coadhesin,Adhesion G protein-coupled receptor B3,Thrombospondin-1,Mucin-like protein,Adhesion G protein-coupled receptor B1 [Mytilus edulis]|uniref:Hemicentin-1,Coadhesin,Adhesion G protein-coupled receptor B3,Thrombospondin-1,Mucin-like protein,Adhesion G protein-coupled receptor B1 n=1 Tax=Mytilus edulis TaxID=6550 RepID=A0A8S3VHV9_MYTED|nr:Hemicentin-1,Coadhesin,Adhesion G protein-coupled receptor B3,Thrombospondin-1,Mucin-like protein,Adhesion G protein-coupled receptor B1 [Mytilus edulis]
MTDFFQWAITAQLEGDTIECTDLSISILLQKFDISKCTIPVDGQWGSWSTASCSATCGNGVQYRKRTCNDPSPSNGGKDCQGVDNETSGCNSGECSVDGQWGSWSTASCSATCGNGVQYRKRTCNDPSPSNGGKDCQGVDNETSGCNSGECSVDGQWGSWTTSSCSETCGNGVQYRNRTCNDPSPSNGGKDCQGVDNESSDCNSGDCSVDGQWGSWTTTLCSVTCGNGVQYRNRTCNDPSPSNGGKDCQGVDNESSDCNSGDCSVDGHWGPWLPVTCSVTCGNGIGIRTRRCDNPPPSGNGNSCVGCDMERKLCSLAKCHKSCKDEGKNQKTGK